jgi:hypothetical protein
MTNTVPHRVVPQTPGPLTRRMAAAQLSAGMTVEGLMETIRADATLDPAILTRIEAEVDRLHRADLGTPAMRAATSLQILIHLEQLPQECRAVDVPALATAAAESLFGDVSLGRAIANILSIVVPYQQGLMFTGATTIRIEGLRAAARAARRAAGPLQRLNADEVFAKISPRLRCLAELAHSDAPTETQPSGSSMPLADPFLLGSVGGRRLGRLEILRDVLAGIEAVALAHAPPRHRELAALGRDLEIVARQLRLLREAMAILEDRLLRGLVPARLGDMAQGPMVALVRLLKGFAEAADAAARTMQPPMGRPKTSDPLQLGVKELALLWHEARGTPIRTTRNKGGFCDLCLHLLGPKGLGFKESAVRGVVRDVVLARTQLAMG